MKYCVTLRKAVALLALVLATRTGRSYSVQTHEELIDLAWRQSIRPLLLRRFPNLTEPQLKEAHAYAYGGSAIQDFGYYPFGNAFFSDLTHYVRSGDFVLSLVRDARTPNELAFAIGSLSHYIGDTIGHEDAVNLAVPVEFPGLEAKYGPVVNYGEDPHAHVRTEFAFDINQISKHRFAPSDYQKHVGLEIPSRLLNRAFFETYGLHIPDLLGRRRAALRVYRFGVRSFIPAIARAETILHGDDFPADLPSEAFDRLSKDFLREESSNQWKRYQNDPGIRSHMLAGVIFILPKVGVLSMLSIRGPDEQTEDLYIKSVYRSIAAMRLVLANFDSVATYLPNRDLDTGKKVRPGGYKLTDQTYAKLLGEIVRKPAQPIPAELKRDIAAYYADPSAPISTRNDKKRWAKVQADLKVLQSMPTVGERKSAQASLSSERPSPRRREGVV